MVTVPVRGERRELNRVLLPGRWGLKRRLHGPEPLFFFWAAGQRHKEDTDDAGDQEAGQRKEQRMEKG
ncbi:hypothetical protein NDU88_004184 [Pleurodeles waltl]|uniref:Uncharacterized protein n=1 Tax=Pleurodeles waltl TaxID=8319 RepID=A0AAV7W8A9_PLEWA|nr:hypothetical protein NDU88_004184 [Pleurodeles waltl]